MKTISIKQPWSFLICSGIKDIENRTWNTNYRGRVLVHASATISTKQLTWEQSSELAEYPDIELIKSAIIGSVEIVDCVINHPSIWAEKTHEFCIEQKLITYNWVLANPVLFAEPILNVKGKLSFWEYPMTEDEYYNRAKIGNPFVI